MDGRDESHSALAVAVADRSWVEFENLFRATEAERDELKAQLAQRCERIVAFVANAAAGGDVEGDGASVGVVQGSGGVAAIEGRNATRSDQECEELRSQVAEAHQTVAKHVSSIAEEQERYAKLHKEFDHRLVDLTALSTEKWQLQHEKRGLEAMLRPIREERDRLLCEKAETETSCQEAKRELEVVLTERSSLFHEKAALRRDFERDLEDARADAQFHENVAKEARAMQERARRERLSAEEKLFEQAEAFAAERAALEAKLTARSEELRREGEFREIAQKRLAEETFAKDASEISGRAAAGEVVLLRARVVDLETQLQKAQREHEDALRNQIPDASDAELPKGFSSLAELVNEVSTARDHLKQERQAKEELQHVLREVEREVRFRYPALLSQREEVERLRTIVEQLRQQNEGLLARVHELEHAQGDAEYRKSQAQKSVTILEAHAQDLARQLAVLVHENRKLIGDLKVPVGASELQVLEDDRVAFRTVSDLVTQNEKLRKTVARLQHGCETKAQEAFQDFKMEQEQQLNEWTKHLAEKAEQMKALTETVQRLTHERDELQRRERERPQAPRVPTSPPLTAGTDQALSDQFASLREEFSKSVERLTMGANAARAAEHSTRHDIAMAQARADFERERGRDEKAKAEKAEQQLEESRVKQRKLEKETEKLSAALQKQGSLVQERDAALASLRQEKQLVQARLTSETSKIKSLEEGRQNLLAEKAIYLQKVSDLEARITQERESNREARHDLETAFKREEKLFREQLDLSKRRQCDLEQNNERLVAGKLRLEEEMQKAIVSAEELAQAKAQLEVQLAQRLRESESQPVSDRGAGGGVGHIDAIVQAEAQLSRSEAPIEKDPRVAEIERQLRLAEERGREHAASTETWKALIQEHERDLQIRQEKIVNLQRELGKEREKSAKSEAEADSVRQKEQVLSADVQQLRSEAIQLRSSLEKKEAEVDLVRHDVEGKFRDKEEELATERRERALDRQRNEDLQQRYRSAASAHSRDMKDLEETRLREAELKKEMKELRQQNMELLGNVERLKVERDEEQMVVKEELDREKKHTKELRLENQRYQDSLVFLSQHKGQQTDDSEFVKRFAAEMRSAREMGELQRHELELDKVRLENETKSLRSENTDLQRRVDAEQQQVFKLQAEIRREQRAVAKLGQLGLLEDENRRLGAATKSLEERLAATSSELAVEKAKTLPLEQGAFAHQKKEDDWARDKCALEAKADQWRRLYDDLLVKYNAYDVQHSTKREAQVTEMRMRMEKLQDELRQKASESTQHSVLRKSIEDKTREHAEAVAKSEQLTAQVQTLTNERRLEEAEKRRAHSLRELALKEYEKGQAKLTKREEELLEAHAHCAKQDEDLQRLQAKCTKQEDDLQRLQAELAKVGAAPATGAASLKKVEDDRNYAQQQADRAMGLAIDYQRAIDAFRKERENEKSAHDMRKAQVLGELGPQPGAAAALGTSAGVGGGGSNSTANFPVGETAQRATAAVMGLPAMAAGQLEGHSTADSSVGKRKEPPGGGVSLGASAGLVPAVDGGSTAGDRLVDEADQTAERAAKVARTAHGDSSSAADGRGKTAESIVIEDEEGETRTSKRVGAESAK